MISFPAFAEYIPGPVAPSAVVGAGMTGGLESGNVHHSSSSSHASRAFSRCRNERYFGQLVADL